jgi:hypothetical protein
MSKKSASGKLRFLVKWTYNRETVDLARGQAEANSLVRHTDYAGMCSQDLADLVFAQPDGFLGGKGQVDALAFQMCGARDSSSLTNVPDQIEHNLPR